MKTLYAVRNENKICCPNCKVLLNGGITEYGLCNLKGKKYFEFKRRCPECDGKFIYFSDPSFDMHYTYEEICNGEEKEIEFIEDAAYDSVEVEDDEPLEEIDETVSSENLIEDNSKKEYTETESNFNSETKEEEDISSIFWI